MNTLYTLLYLLSCVPWTSSYLKMFLQYQLLNKPHLKKWCLFTHTLSPLEIVDLVGRGVLKKIIFLRTFPHYTHVPAPGLSFLVPNAYCTALELNILPQSKLSNPPRTSAGVKPQISHGLNWLGWHLQNWLLCKQDREDSRGKITGYSEY